MKRVNALVGALTLALLLGSSVLGADPIIVTVAGDGTNGVGTDGVLATLTHLANPYGVAVDAAGNIYIADTGSHRVRKVNASDGKISTVAGTGTPGYLPADDGAPATLAMLNSPTGVAVDSFGNLYIADYGNNRIRQVNSSDGAIGTVAGDGSASSGGDGNLATAAQIWAPSGVFVDANRSVLYIAETNGMRIRKVTFSNSKIETVAGTGTGGYLLAEDGGPATSAMINNPTGIFVDASGTMYIADYFNNRIRKVEATTNTISTVAGCSSAVGYDGDGDLATVKRLYTPYGVSVDCFGNIYIADTGNNRIRKVDVATKFISTVTGTTAGYTGDNGPPADAKINQPYGVCVSAGGVICIADKNNNVIRKIYTPSPAASVPVPEQEDRLYIYPHPMKCPGGNAVFRMKKDGKATLQVVNLRGQVVKEIVKDLAASDTATIPVLCADVKDGVYLVIGELKYSDGTTGKLKPYKLIVAGGR